MQPEEEQKPAASCGHGIATRSARLSLASGPSCMKVACGTLPVALLLGVVLLSLATTERWRAEASALNAQHQQELGSDAHQSVVAASSAAGGGGYNNLDNLISDFLDDAGNRLKKSKLNSMRQIKPTLRFGRRSDPLMGATLADQLAMIDGEDAYDSNQRRLLAAALASAADK